MPGGKGKIRPQDGKQFSSTYQPAKNGRKPSIKNQLSDLLMKDGVLLIPNAQIIEKTAKGVKIKLPKQEAIAFKLISWAMSNKGGDSIKAIQMIMEQFDGKPNQPLSGPGGGPIEIAGLTDEQLEAELNKIDAIISKTGKGK